MSWLSELFGGGGEDPAAVRAREAATLAQQQKSQQDAEAAAQQQRDQQFAAMMESLRQMNAPSPEDERLKALQAQQAEQEAQRTDLRQKAMASLGGVITPDFEYGAIPTTFADPYAASAYTAQRKKADDYLSNLLKRGVITQQGYAGGQAALDEQAPRVRSQLADVGNTLLGAERGALTDIANRAKSTASTIDLGQNFDPSAYGTEIQNSIANFVKSLPDKYAGAVPEGLFDTSSLAAKAGAAQGAQNLPFDPNVGSPNLPITSEEDTVPKDQTPKRTTSVF